MSGRILGRLCCGKLIRDNPVTSSWNKANIKTFNYGATLSSASATGIGGSDRTDRAVVLVSADRGTASAQRGRRSDMPNGNRN